MLYRWKDCDATKMLIVQKAGICKHLYINTLVGSSLVELQLICSIAGNIYYARVKIVSCFFLSPSALLLWNPVAFLIPYASSGRTLQVFVLYWTKPSDVTHLSLEQYKPKICSINFIDLAVDIYHIVSCVPDPECLIGTHSCTNYLYWTFKSVNDWLDHLFCNQVHQCKGRHIDY